MVLLHMRGRSWSGAQLTIAKFDGESTQEVRALGYRPCCLSRDLEIGWH